MAEEQVERRLAAILAADVVGYSRLMEANEERTLGALRQHRREFFDPTVAKHGGRIFKVMGDGFLVEFGSVSECGALCGRNPARHAGAQCRDSRGPAHQIPHRHQSRRHHRRRRRLLWRRRQHGGAARRACGAGRHRLFGGGAQSGRQQARTGVPRSGRKDRQEHRPAGACLFRQSGRRRRERRRSGRGRHRSASCAPTSRRWRSCRSPT